jgi:alpha-D-ribose 1-methylphosphonate 5-triphosphate diphosphatase
MRTSLFSKRVVAPEGVVAAQVEIEDGHIVAIVPSEMRSSSDAHDLGDDFLIPGLVDIHTDNLEKHYQPRPGAHWDSLGAALAHDGQCIMAGITTVFDSLSLHGRKDGLDRKEALAPMIAAMDQAGAEGLLRAEHLLHLRCEITNPELLSLVEPHLDNPRLKLLSVMDHTPGQRQTADLNRFKERMEKAGTGRQELDAMLAEQTDWRDQTVAPKNRETIVALAREFGIALMSHDDATIEHVEESHQDGCVAAEFPVSLVAAQRARELGLLNVMGGPNFVRGASHSGNLSAQACAAAGLLDILSSDYVPLSMIRAAFMLVEAPFNWPIQRAIDTVAKNPAHVCGLTDRGEIKVGQRADMVRVYLSPTGWPIVRAVWREGQAVG